MLVTLGTLWRPLMTVALHFCDGGGGDALVRRRQSAGSGKQDGESAPSLTVLSIVNRPRCRLTMC